MDDIIRPKKEKIEPEPVPEPKKEEIREEFETIVENPKMELKSSRPLLKWEAFEYEYIPKSNNWFWSVGIIALSATVASALLSNMLFAILVIIATLTIILYGIRKPKKIMFSFTARGIQVENRLYPYENLHSFWIHYEPPVKKNLTIEPKKLLMQTLLIPLGDTDPNIIREHLLKFLKEERNEESIIQTISRILGF